MSPADPFAKVPGMSREMEFRMVRQELVKLARLYGIEPDGTGSAHMVMARIVALAQKNPPLRSV